MPNLGASEIILILLTLLPGIAVVGAVVFIVIKIQTISRDIREIKEFIRLSPAR